MRTRKKRKTRKVFYVRPLFLLLRSFCVTHIRERSFFDLFFHVLSLSPFQVIGSVQTTDLINCRGNRCFRGLLEINKE